MLEEYSVKGYQQFVDLMNGLVSQRYDRIIALFCGSLDPNGESWCSDCRAGTNTLPLIQRAVLILKRTLTSSPSIKFAYIFIGIDKDDWKGHPNSAFRRDRRLEISSVPTLVLWEYGAQVMRLEEQECSNERALDIMFST